MKYAVGLIAIVLMFNSCRDASHRATFDRFHNRIDEATRRLQETSRKLDEREANGNNIELIRQLQMSVDDIELRLEIEG